jgi:pyridoxine/pyridoxamine 5'-phosphate oxidase
MADEHSSHIDAKKQAYKKFVYKSSRRQVRVAGNGERMEF